MSCEQESGEGAADKRVSWPGFCLGVRGHCALLLGQPDFTYHILFEARVVNHRAPGADLLTQDITIDPHVIRLFAPGCERQAAFDPIATLR
jgi:hypothetical protein